MRPTSAHAPTLAHTHTHTHAHTAGRLLRRCRLKRLKERLNLLGVARLAEVQEELDRGLRLRLRRVQVALLLQQLKRQSTGGSNGQE